MKPLWNRNRSVTLKYFQGVSQSKELPATAKQRYCQGVLQSKVLTGSAVIKIRPESATNETTIMECNTLGNARIESIGIEHIWHQSGVEDTARVCHNQKNCQEVSQSKEHHESATIKRISRTSHNQKFYQGVPQLWVLSGSTTKSPSRECYN